MNETTREERCECPDPCCSCEGICREAATTRIYRVDMDDEQGAAFCDNCTADAMGSGVFCTRDDASDAADIGVEALVAEMSSRGCSGEEIDDAVEARCNETDPAPLCPVCSQGMEQRWDRSWACIEADRSICTR